MIIRKSIQAIASGCAHSIDLPKFKDLGMKNMRVVDSSIVSGPTLETKTIEEMKEIKSFGIDTIIDFRADGSSELQKKCLEAGINYERFPLDNVLTLDNPKYFSLTKDNKRQISDEFVEKLRNYFAKMNSQQNLYVGCQYGIDRTNVGLTLNYLLNPKATNHNAPEILTWPGERKKTIINKLTKNIKKIFKSLTPEQKNKLGIDADDSNTINTQIRKLLQKNHSIDINA